MRRVVLASLVSAAILVAVSCRKNEAVGVHIGSDLSSLVPRNATALAGFEVEKVKATAFYKRHQQGRQLPMLDALSERIGLDPRRDVRTALVSITGDQVLALVSGRFSRRELEPKFVAMGARTAMYRSERLLTIGSESVLFPQNNAFVAGSTGAVQAYADAGSGGISNALAARLETVPAADQIWAVSNQKIPLSRIPMRSDVSSALSNIADDITGFSGGVAVGTGLRFQADLNCASDENAQRVRDALRGGVGLARLTIRDDQLPMLQVYDAIHIEQDHSTVHIKADLSPELSDRLLQALPNARRFLQR